MQRRTTRRTSRLVAAVGLTAATLSVAPPPASAAATITVNSTEVGVADDGQCTLPEAITAANTDTSSGATAGECLAGSGSSDRIFLPTGSTISVDHAGLPPITDSLGIRGQGAVIDGTNAGTQPGLTIQDGSGFVALSSVTVRGFAGGGIVSTNSGLTIVDSWIDGNGSVESGAGGISLHSTDTRTLTIVGSTISNNSTSASGGGLSLSGSIVADIENSTIANNTASNEAFEVSGGGIYFDPAGESALTVLSSTIVGNSADVGAGILRAGAAALTMAKSIVADNNGGGDVDGSGGNPYTSGGGNVIGDGTNTGDFIATDDIIGQTAGVAALANNGGTTPTMALQPGSPAIDRITTGNAGAGFDQRGITRPQGPHPDSGAFEYIRPELTTLPAGCQAYSSLGSDGALAQGEAPRSIQITGSCGIPNDATAVVVTVTAFEPQAPGNLRLSAAGVVPNGGVVNFTNNGLDNTNTVIIELSSTGAIDLSANGGTAPNGTPLTDVSLTALAYYAPTLGLDYFPVTPCAVADSRPTEGATGDFEGPFDAATAMPAVDVVNTFPLDQGGGNTDCGVPASADTVVVNLVAVNATGPGNLGVPGAQVVAFDAIGMNNSVVAYLNLNGGETAQITAFGAATHVRIVVLGYLDDVGGGTAYTPVTPCAAFDTRTTEGATGAFAGLRNGDNVTTYQITGTIPIAQGGNGGNCGVPSNATAVLINLVAVNSVRAGNLQAYATGTAATGGVVNFAALTPPMNNANAVPIPVNLLGEMDVRTNAGPSGVGLPTTHIRGIILGYYTG